MAHLQPSASKSSSSSSTTPSAHPFPPRFKSRSIFTPRSITAPLAALVMAGLLYTYSVTSIRAAKRNAQLHREADGGQLDMRKESLRRHGVLERVEGTRGYELFRDVRVGGDKEVREEVRRERDFLNQGRAEALGTRVVEEEGRARTEVEGGLEGYKGRGNLVRKMREDREGG